MLGNLVSSQWSCYHGAGVESSSKIRTDAQRGYVQLVAQIRVKEIKNQIWEEQNYCF